MTGALAIVYNASDANLSALHADQYVKLFLKPFLMNRSWISQSVLLLALVAIGCDSQTEREVSSDGKQKVVLMLNWFPEAEHGGFYAAQAEGIFEKYGLEVEIRPGGPSAPVAQELVAGRVDFAIGNADDVLIFRQQDVPVVALMAPIQDTPRCILVHEASDANSLEELAGLTMQAGGGRPYLTFMQAK